MVTDSRGRTTTQTCGADLRTMLGYPGLYPTEDAPWLVTIIVQPKSVQSRVAANLPVSDYERADSCAMRRRQSRATDR